MLGIGKHPGEALGDVLGINSFTYWVGERRIKNKFISEWKKSFPRFTRGYARDRNMH